MTEELLTKRLLYRSKYRGNKEMDLYLGKFASLYLHTLPLNELLDYEQLLDESDNDIYDWITRRVSYPAKYDLLMQKLLKFEFVDKPAVNSKSLD